MKRIIAAVLTVSIFLCFSACEQESVKIQDPVNFYYRRSELVFGADDGVIAPQPAESAGHEEDYIWLLKEYLKGPTSDGFARTFPFGTNLLSLTLEDNNADVLLTAAFSQLHDMELTIACACITMTVIELTGVETVTIHTNYANLDGVSQIIMDSSCLLLIDVSAAAPVKN